MMILPVETATQLAQSLEHETLNIGVVGSSPTLGDLRFKFCLTVGQIKHTVNIPKIAHQYLFEISHPRIGNKINQSWNAYIPLENISEIIYLPNNLQFNWEINIIINKNSIKTYVIIKKIRLWSTFFTRHVFDRSDVNFQITGR